MKRLVIRRPKEGRKSVALLTHRYVGREEARAQGIERGTKTIYLGSFPADLDPSRLTGLSELAPGRSACGITLRPGVTVDGRPFNLQTEDLDEIRAWLQTHGDLVKREVEAARRRVEAESRRHAERQAMERELRASLRAELRAELAAQTRDRTVLEAIRDAVNATNAAAEAVVLEGERLASAGVEVTSRAKAAAGKGAHLAALISATLDLRRDAFERFEAACKKARLMSQRTSVRR